MTTTIRPGLYGYRRSKKESYQNDVILFEWPFDTFQSDSVGPSTLVRLEKTIISMRLSV